MTEKFLIVDDDADSAHLTFRHLRAAFPDAHVVHVATGPDAIEEVKAHTDYHAIITDYRMPMMNGLTVIREIRKLDPHIPVILRTAMEDMEGAAKDAGANHVLPWYRWDELGHVLHDLLHSVSHGHGL
jgi:CheY-like chemotaxis protein